MPLADTGAPLLDFSRPGVVQTFRVINDGVMGGVSASRIGWIAGAMLFKGALSLDNNGGFASLQGPLRIPAESAALLLRPRGDGKRCKLTLKLDDSTRFAQYQAAFVAPRVWQTLCFKATDFAASYRGRAVAAPSMRSIDVQYFGVLISDQQSGMGTTIAADGGRSSCSKVYAG